MNSGLQAEAFGLQLLVFSTRLSQSSNNIFLELKLFNITFTKIVDQLHARTIHRCKPSAHSWYIDTASISAQTAPFLHFACYIWIDIGSPNFVAKTHAIEPVNGSGTTGCFKLGKTHSHSKAQTAPFLRFHSLMLVSQTPQNNRTCCNPQPAGMR